MSLTGIFYAKTGRKVKYGARKDMVIFVPFVRINLQIISERKGLENNEEGAGYY